MTKSPWTRAAAGALAAGVAAALGGYAACAAVAWRRYGRVPLPRDDQHDELLDRFMPAFDIVERHQVHIAAPAWVTMDAAREQDLLQLPPVRAIFRAREVVLGATPDDRQLPKGLLAATLALGWGVLGEVPDREIVVGAATRPWEPNVTFRPIPPDEFAAFGEPGFVKIVWTLRVDPIDEGRSIFRTETRAIATDATARAWFRRYWAFASPGIVLIRKLSLGPLRREAEQRACMVPQAFADRPRSS